MDYQEAIEALQFEGGIEITGKPRRVAEFFDGVDTAISAMQELQLYKDAKLCLIPEDVYGNQCEELDRYKQLGTLEEVREAVEKQKAKKPLLGGNTDKLTGDIHICPCCCGIVGMDDARADYCADCGQHIDWSEVEE